MVGIMAVDTRMRLSKDEVRKFAERFGGEEPKEVLEWALRTFYPKIALASSFSAEDVVLIDMLWRINPEVKVFTLDTGRLHQETYDLIDEIRQRYGVKVEVYYPDTSSVEKMVREHGVNLFYESVELRTLCCQIRKIKPLERALSGLDAWTTGLRREQSATRADIKKVEVDELHGGIIKVNPLADWTYEQVWDYIKAKKVPYNKLYDKGYASIGCEPCTRPIKPGEDPRAGRWWWELGVHKECGIHCRIRRER
jgi:thioredoxin-dependent adenylylsulfate APS reductase